MHSISWLICRLLFLQRDDSTLAHRYLGLLAYTLDNSNLSQIKQKGVHPGWREILCLLNTYKCVFTAAQNKKGQVIQIRKCSEPEPNVMKIYDALKYKHAPITRKKSVVLIPENKKKRTTTKQRSYDNFAASWVNTCLGTRLSLLVWMPASNSIVSDGSARV